MKIWGVLLLVGCLASGVYADIKESEDISEEELCAALAADGVDPDELKSAFLDDFSALSGAQKRSLAAREKPVTFETLVADQQGKYAPSPAGLAVQELEYQGSEVAGCVQLQDPAAEMGSKLIDLIEHKVKNKKPETIMMTGFFVMRLIVWFYHQYLIEGALEAHKSSKDPSAAAYLKTGGLSFFERSLSMVGLDSRFLSYTEFALRSSIVAARFWCDFSRLKDIMLNGYWMRNPEIVPQFFVDMLRHARYMMTEEIYIGSQVSVLKQALVTVGVPALWVLYFGSGSMMQNRLCLKSVATATRSVSSNLASVAEHTFVEKLSAEKRSSLFHSTCGVVREELFTRLAWWTTQYTVHSLDKKTFSAGTFFAREAGEYAIEHVYCHGVIGLITFALRNGGISLLKMCGGFVETILHKMGFFTHKPSERVTRMMHTHLVDHNLLGAHDSLNDALMYPATLFPGAFVRAVKQVIKKSELEAVVARSPRFLSYLEKMYEQTAFDVLRTMQSSNPFVFQTMRASVEGVKKGVTREQWDKILSLFVNELIIETFFDRERILCQFITEKVIVGVSKPLLQRWYDRLLPKKLT